MTSMYGYQPSGPSAYSPFNRSATAASVPTSSPSYGATASPSSASSPYPAMGVDSYLAPSSPEDMDRLSNSIDSKIAQIRQAFSQPSPTTPGAQMVATAQASVSQAEISWALDLEQKVNAGQQPSQQDVARYEDIARRLQASQSGTAAPTAAPSQAPTTSSAVSDADIQWALELEQKVNAGHQPVAQDIARYEDIARRLQAAQSGAAAPPAATTQAPAAVSDADIQWALELEQKVNAGHQPVAQDVARYEDIARRLQAAQSGTSAPAGAPAAAGSQDWANWSRPFAAPSVPTMPLPMAGPTGSPSIHVPTSLRSAPAVAPAPQVAAAPSPQIFAGVSQQEIDWAVQLEGRVSQQNYQPTAQEMAQYENIALRLQASQQGGQTPAAAPAQAPAPVAPVAAAVSQQELDWAVQLENRVNGQGYQPTAQEVAQYENIAQRLQTSQQPAPAVAPAQQPQFMAPAMLPAPTAAPAPAVQTSAVPQQELDWALQLENRVNNQGYQPTAQEMAHYENIAQRLQMGAQAGSPQVMPYQPPVPQQPQFQQPTVGLVPQNYPTVQPGMAPQYLQAPQPFMPPQQATAPGMAYSQPAPQQQSPGMMDRLKNAWSALWN